MQERPALSPPSPPKRFAINAFETMSGLSHDIASTRGSSMWKESEMSSIIKCGDSTDLIRETICTLRSKHAMPYARNGMSLATTIQSMWITKRVSFTEFMGIWELFEHYFPAWHVGAPSCVLERFLILSAAYMPRRFVERLLENGMQFGGESMLFTRLEQAGKSMSEHPIPIAFWSLINAPVFNLFLEKFVLDRRAVDRKGLPIVVSLGYRSNLPEFYLPSSYPVEQFYIPFCISSWKGCIMKTPFLFTLPLPRSLLEMIDTHRSIHGCSAYHGSSTSMTTTAMARPLEA